MFCCSSIKNIHNGWLYIIVSFMMAIALGYSLSNVQQVMMLSLPLARWNNVTGFYNQSVSLLWLMVYKSCDCSFSIQICLVQIFWGSNPFMALDDLFLIYQLSISVFCFDAYHTETVMWWLWEMTRYVDLTSLVCCLPANCDIPSQEFNVSSESLDDFFGGPAFLAWARMGNLHA